MTQAIAPPAPRIPAAALLGVQFAAMWGAFLILAPSIDWPASLDAPPEVILPLIVAQAGPVFAGYLSYLVHALLLIPLAVLLRHTLRMSPVLGGLALAFGVLAGLAKALGILRWLVLMPGLAAGYAGADAPTRTAIGVVYEAFNAYAGGVGEVLGVGLLSGLWTLMLSVALLRLGARVLGLAGLLAGALLLATLLTLWGLDSPLLLTGSGIFWQVWLAVLAVWHLVRRNEEKRA